MGCDYLWGGWDEDPFRQYSSPSLERPLLNPTKSSYQRGDLPIKVSLYNKYSILHEKNVVSQKVAFQ